MIGEYNKDLNKMQYRDLAEYATMSILYQAVPDLRKKGERVTPSQMQSYRDAWTRDGEPMDFSHMRARKSDFVNLLESTGATHFGKWSDDYASLDEAVGVMWAEAKKDYEAMARSGHFMHAVTDPEIREHITEHADNASAGVLSKGVFVVNGRSARSMKPGDQVTFRDRKTNAPLWRGAVGAPVNEAVAGDNVAETAPAPEQTPAPQPSAPEARPEPSADADSFESDEVLHGWHGNSEAGYRGLSHIFGAYLSKADAEIVAKNISQSSRYDARLAHNTLELLQHMRSNGYDFDIDKNSKPGRIEANMTAGDRLSVRLFDPDDNGAYIGRVYDRYNAYYLNVAGGRDVRKNTTFNPEDATAVLDYVMGQKTGTVKKAVSRDTSEVEIEGVERSKKLQVSPIAGRYRSLVYSDAAEAEAFIRTGIDQANDYVNKDFDAASLQALIDAGLDDDSVMVTGPEFQAELEAHYSHDAIIREAQERAVGLMKHSQDGGLEHLEAVRADIVGNYEDGFNPAFVADHMDKTDRGNERDALMAAMKTAEYDTSKIKGNDFAVNAMREKLIRFDPETARGIDDVEHPMEKYALETVRDTLKASALTGDDGKDPEVKIDDQGIIQWAANRRTGSNKPDKKWQAISGEIGQVMVPDKDGIIQTKFDGDNNYGIVPGYTGYFSFEGDYDDRMNRFRVKGFDQHLGEQLRASVTHQVTRPYDESLGNIPTTLDASGINGLYHGDVYGKRIEQDFMETNQLEMRDKKAILDTLSNRVRFDNQYSDHATTSAETQANRELGAGDDMSSFSYWKAAGETNMRVLDKDIENYADMTMTGTGKTQGLIWYLADGAEVNKDGSVTPSKGLLQPDGTYAPDQTAIKKLPYFDKETFNAWDRTQMSANQMMTALKVDKDVNTALMSFGGWTFDDSYAVSKEFADRNKVRGDRPNEDSMAKLDEVIEHSRHYADAGFTKEEALKDSGMMWSDAVIAEGAAMQQAIIDADSAERTARQDDYESFLEEHGTFRPLQRGDKLSDFGGNKGTIGIVIDRDMDPAEAEAQDLGKEVRFLKANPDLDVISAPYSMLSRHNAGVVKEMMDGEPQDLTDPDTGEVYEAAMGKLNLIVTDMVVDDKTHAYTREDVLDGKGRKASGQLAWALQSKGADGIMDEIYGRNDSAWETYREYLIATGLDMGADGTIHNGYTPHADEARTHFSYDPEVDSTDFLDTIRDQGGFLDVPFDMEFKTGEKTDSVPVLSASLRQNVELVDGTMRRSDFTNHYANMYEAVGEYHKATDDADKTKAQEKAQKQFDAIQSTIIDRQFDGGHNGKHSYIRDKIMGKRMQNSATGVAVVDPRLDIGEAGMNQDMMDALSAKEGDMVMMFRDPVWRDGAIRAMTVKHDDSVHGVAFNPITDKSHDGDFDGDTYGLMKFDSYRANEELKLKFTHHANMFDTGSSKENDLYFQSGMDLASAEAKAEAAGDNTPKELYERTIKQANSKDPRVVKQSASTLNDYSHKLFREYGFGGDYVSLKDDASVFESFGRMVENGAKGSEKHLGEYKAYHEGRKTDVDAREVQYATGVKTDDTGLAGAFSQKLVSTMRNQNITAALESMYPLTQGTLQIKKDADHARTVNDILTDDMNKIFRGKDVHNPKRDLTPKRFNKQLTDTLTDKMRVDVNPEHIDAITETLTHKGELLPLKDAMQVKGSPMDRVAYGGGYSELVRMSKKGESLLEGKQNKLFAPFTMRNADAETKLVKRDTQQVVETATEPETVQETTHADVEPEREKEDAGLAL